MLQFEELDKEKQFEVYNRAFTWRHDHADHVANLLKDCKDKVAPSGSDIFRPELWKSIHWKWFLEDLSDQVDKNER